MRCNPYVVCTRAAFATQAPGGNGAPGGAQEQIGSQTLAETDDESQEADPPAAAQQQHQVAPVPAPVQETGAANVEEEAHTLHANFKSWLLDRNGKQAVEERMQNIFLKDVIMFKPDKIVEAYQKYVTDSHDSNAFLGPLEGYVTTETLGNDRTRAAFLKELGMFDVQATGTVSKGDVQKKYIGQIVTKSTSWKVADVAVMYNIRLFHRKSLNIYTITVPDFSDLGLFINFAPNAHSIIMQIRKAFTYSMLKQSNEKDDKFMPKYSNESYSAGSGKMGLLTLTVKMFGIPMQKVKSCNEENIKLWAVPFKVYNGMRWKLGCLLRLTIENDEYFLYKICDMVSVTGVSVYYVTKTRTLDAIRVHPASQTFDAWCLKHKEWNPTASCTTILDAGIQIVTEKPVRITTPSLQTLQSKGMLDSQVLDWFFQWWCEENEFDMVHDKDDNVDCEGLVLCANTEVYVAMEKQLSENRDPTKWSKFFEKKRNPHKAKMLLLPVNIGDNHWVLAKITFNANAHTAILQWYDSISTNQDTLEDLYESQTTVLATWLHYSTKFGMTLQWGPTGRLRKDQSNGYDCGVWVCMYAMFLSMSQECDLEESQVDKFRAWMIHEMDERGKAANGGQSNTMPPKEQVTRREHAETATTPAYESLSSREQTPFPEEPGTGGTPGELAPKPSELGEPAKQSPAPDNAAAPAGGAADDVAGLQLLKQKAEQENIWLEEIVTGVTASSARLTITMTDVTKMLKDYDAAETSVQTIERQIKDVNTADTTIKGVLDRLETVTTEKLAEVKNEYNKVQLDILATQDEDLKVIRDTQATAYSMNESYTTQTTPLLMQIQTAKKITEEQADWVNRNCTVIVASVRDSCNLANTKILEQKSFLEQQQSLYQLQLKIFTPLRELMQNWLLRMRSVNTKLQAQALQTEFETHIVPSTTMHPHNSFQEYKREILDDVSRKEEIDKACDMLNRASQKLQKIEESVDKAIHWSEQAAIKSTDAVTQAQTSASNLPALTLVLTARDVVTGCGEVFIVVKKVVQEKQDHSNAVTDALAYCTSTVRKLDDFSTELVPFDDDNDDKTQIHEKLDNAERVIKECQTNCTEYQTLMGQIENSLAEIKSEVANAIRMQDPNFANFADMAMKKAQGSAQSAADLLQKAQDIRAQNVKLQEAQTVYNQFETEFQVFKTKKSSAATQPPPAPPSAPPSPPPSAPAAQAEVAQEPADTNGAANGTDTSSAGNVPPAASAPTSEASSTSDQEPETFTAALTDAEHLRDMIELLSTRCKKELGICDQNARQASTAKDKSKVKCTITDQIRTQITQVNLFSDVRCKALYGAIEFATQLRVKFRIEQSKQTPKYATYVEQWPPATAKLKSSMPQAQVLYSLLQASFIEVHKKMAKISIDHFKIKASDIERKQTNFEKYLDRIRVTKTLVTKHFDAYTTEIGGIQQFQTTGEYEQYLRDLGDDVSQKAKIVAQNIDADYARLAAFGNLETLMGEIQTSYEHSTNECQYLKQAIERQNEQRNAALKNTSDTFDTFWSFTLNDDAWQKDVEQHEKIFDSHCESMGEKGSRIETRLAEIKKAMRIAQVWTTLKQAASCEFASVDLKQTFDTASVQSSKIQNKMRQLQSNNKKCTALFDQIDTIKTNVADIQTRWRSVSSGSMAAAHTELNAACLEISNTATTMTSISDLVTRSQTLSETIHDNNAKINAYISSLRNMKGNMQKIVQNIHSSVTVSKQTDKETYVGDAETIANKLIAFLKAVSDFLPTVRIWSDDSKTLANDVDQATIVVTTELATLQTLLDQVKNKQAQVQKLDRDMTAVVGVPEPAEPSSNANLNAAESHSSAPEAPAHEVPGNSDASSIGDGEGENSAGGVAEQADAEQADAEQDDAEQADAEQASAPGEEGDEESVPDGEESVANSDVEGFFEDEEESDTPNAAAGNGQAVADTAAAQAAADATRAAGAAQLHHQTALDANHQAISFLRMAQREYNSAKSLFDEADADADAAEAAAPGSDASQDARAAAVAAQEAVARAEIARDDAEDCKKVASDAAAGTLAQSCIATAQARTAAAAARASHLDASAAKNAADAAAEANKKAEAEADAAAVAAEGAKNAAEQATNEVTTAEVARNKAADARKVAEIAAASVVTPVVPPAIAGIPPGGTPGGTPGVTPTAPGGTPGGTPTAPGGTPSALPAHLPGMGGVAGGAPGGASAASPAASAAEKAAKGSAKTARDARDKANIIAGRAAKNEASVNTCLGEAKTALAQARIDADAAHVAATGSRADKESATALAAADAAVLAAQAALVEVTKAVKKVLDAAKAAADEYTIADNASRDAAAAAAVPDAVAAQNAAAKAATAAIKATFHADTIASKAAFDASFAEAEAAKAKDDAEAAKIAAAAARVTAEKLGAAAAIKAAAKTASKAAKAAALAKAAADRAAARRYGRREYPIRNGVLTYYVKHFLIAMPDDSILNTTTWREKLFKMFDLPPETKVSMKLMSKQLARYQIAPITLEAEVTFTIIETDWGYDVFYCGMYEPGPKARGFETLKSPPELPADA